MHGPKNKIMQHPVNMVNNSTHLHKINVNIIEMTYYNGDINRPTW